MLTKNFYNCMMAILARCNTSLRGISGDSFAAKGANYTTTYSYILNGIKNWSERAGTIEGISGVCFSESLKKPSSDEYCTSQPILDSTIRVLSPENYTVSLSAGSVELSSTFGVSAKKIVNINSVFLTGKWSDDSGVNKTFLIDHTLLETPITLQPGESKQITYTIRFNYPGATA